MEEKSSNRFEKYRLQQLSAHACDDEGDFAETISFLAEKTASPSHSSALHMLFLSGDSASGFRFNSF